jgi:FemAB-related protein (PEP-CTERM system-associated)
MHVSPLICFEIKWSRFKIRELYLILGRSIQSVETLQLLDKLRCSSGCDAAGHAIASPQESKVHIIRGEPGLSERWPMLIQQLDQANLAQLPQWFTAIHKAYGHTSVYLEAEDASGGRGILPSFLIRSRLFGTVLTSMPFLDTGGPCSTSRELSHTLVVSLIEEAYRYGAHWVELRCTAELDLPVPALTDKVTLTLPLTADPDCLWRRLDPKVRNQVRKAERSGLSVEVGGAERLSDFYAVFAVNMRDLGSPVHARSFFEAIFAAFGQDARIVLVSQGTAVIGGLIALLFKDTFSVPWASSLRQYFSLCPNNLLYWETLRSACKEGFQRFDFGRSSRNSGTYRFKRQWGAQEAPLFWYTIPIGRGQRMRLPSIDARGSLATRLWQRLPVSLTRWFGPHIRKCLTQ